MTDDTRHSDSETELDEPVFGSEGLSSGEQELDTPTGFPAASEEPEFGSEASALPPTDLETDRGTEEPVFGADSVNDQSESSGSEEDILASSYEVSDREYDYDAPFSPATDGQESLSDAVDSEELDAETASGSGTNWVQVNSDSEAAADPFTEREYSYFEETPAAEVAASPPPARKLGRTGPVWVLGGVVLVLIVGLGWFGISRLMGSGEETPAAASEPTVQQVAAEAPTPAPPTSTPGPTPTDSPILLPINANVTVGDTGGQGVKLRAGPGLDGELLEIIDEGTLMVVLAAEPESQYSEYPVPKDGYLWYRMRVPGMTDGNGTPVVGWSASDFFVVDVP